MVSLSSIGSTRGDNSCSEDRSYRRTAGDFTGDGKSDLIARTASGDLRLWPGNGNGNGNGTFGGATAPGQ
ncbi:hypothetical protein ACT1U9_09045 [Streptomyces sp. BR1]|uniref:hypothetical protein n=1 Tax=Streptomyces sp. BR1 TaxID=1592323 RepID=UPI00402B33F8